MSYDYYAMGFQNGKSAGTRGPEAEINEDHILPEHLILSEEEAHDYSMGYRDGFSTGQREVEFAIEMGEMEQRKYEEIEMEENDF